MRGYVSLVTKEGDLDVELSGRRWDGQGLTAVTMRGSGRVRVPAEYSAALHLETKDGGIAVDYPDQVVEGEKVPLRVLVKDKASSLKIGLGDGGAPINVFSEAGEIRLSAIPKQ
jgi:hypothetical protein